jgi:SAM-dependent methyltransferase
MASRAEEMFFEVFEQLPRQGPGSLACTARALAMCRDLPASPRVLDLGCGVGAQTLHLASLTRGPILAIDRHSPLIDRLRERLERQGLSGRVEARVGDMLALELPPASFDLVWSEGALYNLGLETALSICARMLRPGGYLAFTDAVWLTADPPLDVRNAFADYPTMRRAEDVGALLERTGWSLLGHFDLPDEAWWDEFYGPMERAIDALRVRHADDPEALAALDVLAAEPQMHRRSGHCYGYTFFISRLGGDPFPVPAG